MAASHTLPHSHAIRKSGVLVLNGYGIRVQVNAGHLLAQLDSPGTNLRRIQPMPFFDAVAQFDRAGGRDAPR